MAEHSAFRTAWEQTVTERIHDSSHALAIVKSELRKVRQFLDRIDTDPGQIASNWSGRRRYRFVRDKIRECLGDSMIMKRVINPYRYSKREVTCFYSLDFLDEDSEHLVPGGLAIGFMGIDSKHPEKELEHILCLIPEHLLGRLILREQYQGLADIARHVLPLTVTLIYIFTGDVPVPSEFVILLASGYYAMKRDDGTSIPVAKTWIPRSRYTPEQDAKLGQISAALGNDALVIDSPTFNKAHYIDPIALERPRLLGVDSFVEKIPDVVGLSRTRRY